MSSSIQAQRVSFNLFVWLGRDYQKLAKNTDISRRPQGISNNGCISSIYKKGGRKTFQNSRGICIQSYVTKIMDRLVWDELEGTYFTPPEQAGLRVGWPCTDNLFFFTKLLRSPKKKKESSRNDAWTPNGFYKPEIGLW